MCEKCAPGTRTVEFGKPCPGNTLEDEDGDCQICGPGFQLDQRNKRCVVASPVKFFTNSLTCSQNVRSVHRGQIGRLFECGCPDGEVFRNERCRGCPARTYASRNECTPCGENEFSQAGAAYCTPCPEGTTSAGSNGRTCERIRCRKGLIRPPLFRNTFLDSTCISPVTGCPKGLRGLGLRRGHFLCTNRKGKIAYPKGRIFNGNKDCISCSPGWRIAETASERLTCRRCSNSTPLRSGGLTRTCRSCENGFHLNSSDTKCICGEERFIAKNGRCRKCPSLPFPQFPFQCISVG